MKCDGPREAVGQMTIAEVGWGERGSLLSNWAAISSERLETVFLGVECGLIGVVFKAVVVGPKRMA